MFTRTAIKTTMDYRREVAAEIAAARKDLHTGIAEFVDEHAERHNGVWSLASWADWQEDKPGFVFLEYAFAGGLPLITFDPGDENVEEPETWFYVIDLDRASLGSTPATVVHADWRDFVGTRDEVISLLTELAERLLQAAEAVANETVIG